MLIHVAVCGIGLGHVTRSVGVAEELAQRGHRVVFSSYGQGYAYLEHKGLPTSKVTKVQYGVDVDGVISIKRTLINNVTLPVRFAAQTMAEINLLMANDSDVVLSDTRASATFAAKALGKPVATILNQYNLILKAPKHPRLASIVERTIQAPQLIWGLSDILIIPDLPPPYTISEATLQFPDKISEKILYVGPLIKPETHPDNELEKVRQEVGASDKPLVLFAVSGGESEKRVFVEKILSLADRLDGQFFYFMSTADPSKNVEKRVGPLIVRSWVPDMDLYIKASDIVVCRGGLTTISKCILYGKPMVIIPTPQHGEQLSNALKAEQLGIGKVLQQNSFTASDLQKALAGIYNNESVFSNLQTLRNLAQRCGGVEAAASAVEKLG